MDTHELKTLARRIRDVLEQSKHPVGHSQSLDLVAAVPGLRNWPEVLAFPDRVAACELDLSSASRLAFRLRKFEVQLSPEAVLAALSPPGARHGTGVPQIWPTGPKPGVYVTTSQTAIDALLARYEAATDGALFYAERAGSHWDGAIDLGEGGLWSSGLSRVSSGTLLVVGPLELNQQSWDNSASHMEMAALRAQVYDHRVAVLVETETPERVCEDILLMLKSVQQAGDDLQTALTGIVTDDGELQAREAFAPSPRPAVSVRTVARPDAIPSRALPILADVIAQRTSGLLLFGSATAGIEEHRAIDLVAASLALTEHAGPAARIMPRKRSTPSKDWEVPEAIKQLPFLPSIESAYDQGYRRIIFNPFYTKAELLMELASEVLFIAGTWGSNVSDVFMNSTRGGMQTESDLLNSVIAILSVMRMPGKHGELVASDLVVMKVGPAVPSMDFTELVDFLETNRKLRWEDDVAHWLDVGEVTPAKLKKTFQRHHALADFLAQRARSKKVAVVSHQA